MKKKQIKKEENEQDDLANKIESQKQRLSQEQIDEFVQNFSQDFMKFKEKKFSKCTKLYLCLQRNCVTQVMFKNKKGTLEKIL